MNIKKFDYQNILWHTAVTIIVVTELLALGVLAYLGTFTRFQADDYCETINIRNAPLLVAVFQNYMTGRIRAANRFSHLLLVGWSEMLGKHNVQIVPGLMIMIWLIGLAWTIWEVHRLMEVRQSAAMDWFLAITLAFFSAWQAPNLFQTFFWRSSVTTHFAPLVLMFLLSGFMLHQIRSTHGQAPALWVTSVVFISAFIIGGVAEPVTTVMMVLSLLLLIYVWQRKVNLWGQPSLILLTASSIGTLLALIALFFAPGNLLHGETSIFILPQVILQSFRYSLQFVWDTLVTLPLPTLISILIPGIMFFCFQTKTGAPDILPDQQRWIRFALWLVPLIHFFFIAVSFFPSAYGQSYPEERARFVGRFLMTSGLIFEGALLGVWLAQMKKTSAYRQPIFLLAVLVVMGLGLYPLRASASMLQEANGYRTWASAWDARDEYIQKSVSEGAKDLVVTQLNSIGDVVEYKGNKSFWVNVCAAEYYGLHTLVAP